MNGIEKEFSLKVGKRYRRSVKEWKGMEMINKMIINIIIGIF